MSRPPGKRPPRRIRPRPLAPSIILRTTPRQAGGGRSREDLLHLAGEAIARGSRSFSAASLLFDRRTRERVHLLYAWCRRCDDIADGQEFGGPLRPDAESAIDRVEALRILTARALDGQPTADPAFDALGLVAAECNLPADLAGDVLEGFALDAAGWRPRSEADLMRYCYHVAGAVGVMMARVMGVAAEDHDTLDRACDLGLAFQLVNIARDLWEDDAAGRCYLPVEWLVEMDIPPGQHMKPPHRAELVMLAGRLLDLAASHEAAARAGAMRLPFRRRWAVLAAADIYGAIGRKVRRRGAHAWDHRARTGRFEKAGHLARAALQALVGTRAPDHWPKWTRGELMILARMNQPPAPIRITPPRDEE